MKKIVLSILAISITIAGTAFNLQAQAFKPIGVHVHSLCNYQGADLQGANFEGVHFENVNFSGARLDGAIWTDGRRCAKDSIGECK